jgi:predicted transcriptional regulator of viral defense system
VTGFHYLVANKVYSPSYISHQEALLFYGLIPEHIVDSVSVTTKKTMSFNFQNRTYKYYSISPKYFFGYELKDMNVNGIVRNFLMAGREKAILDFLYLYDFYNTGEEISEIRFNETVLESEIDWEKMDNYLERFNNKALTKRIGLIREIYKI